MLGVAQGRQGPAAEISEPDSLDPTDGLLVEQGLADQVLVQPESSCDGSVVGHPHQPERVQDEEVRCGTVRHIRIVGSQSDADAAMPSPGSERCPDQLPFSRALREFVPA